MPATATAVMIQPTPPLAGAKFNLLWIDESNPILPVMKYWTGAIWTPISAPTVVTARKTSDQIINSISFVDIADLTFPVLPNIDYGFDFYIVFQMAVLTTGCRFAINGPPGCVVDYFITQQSGVGNSNPSPSWPQSHWIAFDATIVSPSNVPEANQDLICKITGRVKVGATPGTIAARAASELANNDLVVQKGSWGLFF